MCKIKSKCSLFQKWFHSIINEFLQPFEKKDTWHTKILDESKLHGNKLLHFNVFSNHGLWCHGIPEKCRQFKILNCR